MGEIGFMVQTGSTYDPGDGVAVYSDVEIAGMESQHICNYRHAGFNADGLRPAGSLARRFLDVRYSYRFERVSRTEVRRVAYDDAGNRGEEVLVPAEEIDVPEYIRYAKRSNKHRIFGTAGREYWHGGRSWIGGPQARRAWTLIETHSSHVRDGVCPHCSMLHRAMNWGSEDLYFLAAVRTPVMHFEEKLELDRPQVQNGDTIKKREHRVDDWTPIRSALGVTQLELLDKTQLIGQAKQLPENAPVTAPWMTRVFDDGHRYVFEAESTHTPLLEAVELLSKETLATRTRTSPDEEE